MKQLAEPFEMTQPAISKHLKVLEGAGLITRRQDAQRRLCRIEADRLQDATQWLLGYRDFWTGSFDALDAVLVDLQQPDEGVS